MLDASPYAHNAMSWAAELFIRAYPRLSLFMHVLFWQPPLSIVSNRRRKIYEYTRRCSFRFSSFEAYTNPILHSDPFHQTHFMQILLRPTISATKFSLCFLNRAMDCLCNRASLYQISHLLPVSGISSEPLDQTHQDRVREGSLAPLVRRSTSFVSEWGQCRVALPSAFDSFCQPASQELSKEC